MDIVQSINWMHNSSFTIYVQAKLSMNELGNFVQNTHDYDSIATNNMIKNLFLIEIINRAENYSKELKNV